MPRSWIPCLILEFQLLVFKAVKPQTIAKRFSIYVDAEEISQRP